MRILPGLNGILLILATCGVAFAASDNTPSDLEDLVGVRASSGERALDDRGYVHISTQKGSDRAWSQWWNRSRKTCATVVTYDGRYDSITDSPAFDCNQNSSSGDDDKDNNTAAAVVGIAAVLGAIALAHKSHDHDDNQHYDDQNQESEFDRGYRDGKYNHSFDNYERSDAYQDGYNEGVEDREHETSYRHHSGRYDPGYVQHEPYEDLVGVRASSADSELQDRGFRNVDSFKTGNTAYGIWYNYQTRQCLQMAVADGKADSIVDIHTHPSCH